MTAEAANVVAGVRAAAIDGQFIERKRVEPKVIPGREEYSLVSEIDGPLETSYDPDVTVYEEVGAISGDLVFGGGVGAISVLGGGQQGGEWGRAGNPKSNAENFFRNFECGNVINNVAKAKGKPTWKETLDKATFVSLRSTHPDWNEQLVKLGFPADLLKKSGYPNDITLGAYFSQKDKNIIGLAIPSKNTIYLGERYRNSTGLGYLKTPPHETLHLMFGGSHYDIAKAFQDGAGFLPGVDLSKIPEEALSRQIDAWVFDRRCGRD